MSAGGGTEPRWRGDGKEIFYLDTKGMLMAAPVGSGATFSSGTAQPLFRVRARAPISNTDVFSYDVSKDGSPIHREPLREAVLRASARYSAECDGSGRNTRLNLFSLTSPSRA